MNDSLSSTPNDDAAARSEQAALYALGALSQTEARGVAQALTATPALASDVATFEQVVGLLGLNAPEQAPAPGLRHHLLERIAATPVTQRPLNVRPAASAAERTFTRRASDTGWRSCAPGVFSKTLFVDRGRGTMTTLVRLTPGSQLPRHRHPEAEESYILSGSCTINGETFGVGDYRRAPRGTVDDEITTTDGVVFLMISAMQLDVID